jgi:hypothetical protein
MDASQEPIPQRATDADRHATVEALRDAGGDGRLTVEEMEERLSAAFAARTHAELDALLADLQRGTAVALAGSKSVSSARLPPGAPETATTVAIMGESSRRGVWHPAAKGRVLTVMGESSIDFNEAVLERPVTKLRVFTLMGSTTVRVPEHAHVFVSKLSIMGSSSVRLENPEIAADAPQLHLRLISIMGECAVRRGPRKPRRGRRRLNSAGDSS